MSCIWCRKNYPDVAFTKKAHTFPASLGGQNICENVCDSCNHYFGSPTKKGSSIEVVFKEVLNVSKYLLLHQTNSLQRGKRFKSEYFHINWNSNLISTKTRYRLTKDFQTYAGRQFRKGVFKVFLEERERIKGDALSNKYDFIREFSRYDGNDFPIYSMKPKFQWIPLSLPDIQNPCLRFPEISDELDRNFSVYEYMIMGHNFVIPTSNQIHLTIEDYQNKIRVENHPFGTELISIDKLEDLDFSFFFMQKRLK